MGAAVPVGRRSDGRRPPVECEGAAVEDAGTDGEDADDVEVAEADVPDEASEPEPADVLSESDAEDEPESESAEDASLPIPPPAATSAAVMPTTPRTAS